MIPRLFICLLLAGVTARAEPSLESRFGAAFEQEVRGRFDAAMLSYQSILPDARTSDPGLAGRILYRMGICEQQVGRLESARRLWQELLRTVPPEHPAAPGAREGIKELERETERVHVCARIMTSGDGSREPSPVAKAWVMAGEWGNEPVLVADDNGMIRAERRSAGQRADGRRYVLLYAEHPEKPEAAVAAMGDVRGAEPSVVVLRPTFAVSGRVLDMQGVPVAGARVRPLGLLGGRGLAALDETPAADGGAAITGESAPAPIERILPPVYSDSNGVFTVDGLIPGLRYTFVGEKGGFRMNRALVLDAGAGIPAGAVLRAGATWFALGSIVLHAERQISLQGCVRDDSARGIGAVVSVWTMPPLAERVAVTLSLIHI